VLMFQDFWISSTCGS